MDPIIKTEKLTHVYGAGTPFEHTAIDGIDFEAERGEFIGIIGHTGSGKSTFIQHLNGLIKPTSGRVLLDGHDIFETKERTRETRFRVGLVFQYPEYQLFEETVYKDISFGPKNMKLSEREIDERVREAAGFAGLSEDTFEKSPFDLSGGQKRRTAIAGVMAMRPEVLIFDEPTAGLDPSGCKELMTNIMNYREKTGTTIIMVSHSMEDVARTADRLLVFKNAHIVMQGSPSDVFSHVAELKTMGLTVPRVTLVALRLRELGLPIPKDIYTVEHLKNAIVQLREEGYHA
ncbi:MAG: energy-coupling factor transporter ATPase [Oscillospiraceae bacterium]|nr:energy-coupling factor transporter ATPase [Oscillospiraceae bacterium]